MTKIILLAAIVFCSSQPGFGQKQLKDDADEAKDTKYECFVQQNDSVILKFHEFKLKMLPMTFGVLVGDGEKLKYKAGEVIAFQNDEGYWCHVTDPTIKPLNTKGSWEELYAIRLKKGKIELFYQHNDKLIVDGKLTLKGNKYFIRKGNEITFLDGKGNVLKDAVKDKKKVYDQFDDLFGKGKLENMYDVIDAYNQAR